MPLPSPYIHGIYTNKAIEMKIRWVRIEEKVTEDKIKSARPVPCSELKTKEAIVVLARENKN